jgi:hypothetical protein
MWGHFGVPELQQAACWGSAAALCCDRLHIWRVAVRVLAVLSLEMEFVWHYVICVVLLACLEITKEKRKGRKKGDKKERNKVNETKEWR